MLKKKTPKTKHDWLKVWLPKTDMNTPNKIMKEFYAAARTKDGEDYEHARLSCNSYCPRSIPIRERI